MITINKPKHLVPADLPAYLSEAHVALLYSDNDDDVDLVVVDDEPTWWELLNDDAVANYCDEWERAYWGE